MKKKIFFGLLAAILSLMFLFSGAQAKDKICIGWVTSLSGPYASGVPVTNGMVYELWIGEINAKGGIYVKEYGKRLPIELIRYDDKSDVGSMTKLLEKVILEDKVDLILPPWGTAMGPMRFEKGFNMTRPGEIGQWQKGVFEIIDPGKKRTAKPEYPKPEWPKKSK